MADREFVFGRADVQKLLRDHFVVVAADDWYQRRQNDAVGRFFRSVADQGPRKGKGGGTRQGRYTFSASGKLLGFNNNRDPRRIIAMLQDSLRKFRALPPAERAPGAVQVQSLPPGARDKRYVRALTKDIIPVKVHTRVLKETTEGGYAACGQPGTNTETYRHSGFGVANDHLWLRKAELEQLGRLAREKPGQKVPDLLAMRIARFHLVDNTRGEPPHWRRDEVRNLEFRISPMVPASDSSYRNAFRIAGTFHLETRDGKRGYKGEIDGYMRMHDKTGNQDFHLVAIGDHWGEGTYTRGARPGKNPLAVVFALADRNKPENQVPPQAARWERGYFEAHRH